MQRVEPLKIPVEHLDSKLQEEILELLGHKTPFLERARNAVRSAGLGGVGGALYGGAIGGDKKMQNAAWGAGLWATAGALLGFFGRGEKKTALLESVTARLSELVEQKALVDGVHRQESARYGEFNNPHAVFQNYPVVAINDYRRKKQGIKERAVVLTLLPRGNLSKTFGGQVLLFLNRPIKQRKK